MFATFIASAFVFCLLFEGFQALQRQTATGATRQPTSACSPADPTEFIFRLCLVDIGRQAANSGFSGAVTVHHLAVVMIAQAIGDHLAERFHDAGGDGHRRADMAGQVVNEFEILEHERGAPRN